MSVNPVPAQAIANTPGKGVADRLQSGFVTSKQHLASVISASLTLSVRVSRYAVVAVAFQAKVAFYSEILALSSYSKSEFK